LKSLHLQDNLIDIFESEITTNLPRLVHLNLSNNQIGQLSDNTFKNNMVSLELFKVQSMDASHKIRLPEYFNFYNKGCPKAKSSHFQKARNLRVCNLDPNVAYHWNGTCVSFKLVGYRYSNLFAVGGSCFCNEIAQKYLQAPFLGRIESARIETPVVLNGHLVLLEHVL
jgi:Leucine-rich repeat (LRR) protein